MTLSIDDLVARLAAAEDRLLTVVTALTDQQAADASLLAGWTRGHVVTHLARNADSRTWQLDGVLAGEAREQYPGGMSARAAGIEEGAARRAFDLVHDLRQSVERLQSAIDRMPADAWDAPVLQRGVAVPASTIVWSRWREVEMHVLDLNLGLTPENWPPEFVEMCLDEVAATLGTRQDCPSVVLEDESGRRWALGPVSHDVVTVRAHAAPLLAWVTGRASAGGFEVVGAAAPPTLPAWV